MTEAIDRRAVKNLASLSVISNIILVIMKVLAGLYTHSISVISEAAHSGIDLIAAMMAFWAVRAASKPADKDHPYGHGKIENLSGTVEALLIFVAAILIIYESIKKLQHEPQKLDAGPGFLVMLFSAGVNLYISRKLLRGAKKYDSLALEADGWHLMTDVYTSAGVMTGLFIIWLTHIYILDPVIAIITALVIIKTACEMTIKSIKGLIDTQLPEEEEELIRSIINEHNNEYVNFHKLRTRKAGAERFVDMHLVMNSQTTVEKAHNFCDHLEQDIKAKLNNCNVLIHIEPESSSSINEDKCSSGPIKPWETEASETFNHSKERK
ncbi:MAG TPA: cation diffusion facilitator family transporter [Candidatus Eremiobacteraeota bacterium]|nr:MAG: Ferrous-iron efflux pump FieF [bacterium ADurb.Bin363]HPZ07302.1 cation diffusion facilitator family transporter [Candidatus Eremiobacteraeota bacterium]